MSRLFGTNGIRWIIGERGVEFPVRLGIDAGNFFGAGSRIAVGYDTRTSSPMVFNALVSGLLSSGSDALVLGLVPTPLAQFAVKSLGLGGGLMVTASHNPPEFNGLKFFAPDGTEISRSDEERVEGLHSANPARLTDWEGVGKCYHETGIQTTYKNTLQSYIKDMKNKKLNAIVDCANGAGIGYTPEILTRIGCRVITLNSQPDGRFPGRLPEPTRENVGTLISTVKQHGADLGIAHDGDADRATFVDDIGTYVTGDQSLAIFAKDALRRSDGGHIVVPINTSKMVEDVVKSNGGTIEYTAVGSPLIARRMMEIDSVLGGEGNGGTIFPEHQLCRDGIMAAVRMLGIVDKSGPLSDLVAELPRYATRSGKLKIRPELRDSIMKQVRSDADGQVNEIDGIKFDTEEGWILIRASGTEPIIRVTVETMSESLSESMLADRVKYLKDLIESLS